MLWILAGFFIFCLLAFAAVAILFPEWVGISGKVAKENRDSHSGAPEAKKSLDSFLEGKK